MKEQGPLATLDKVENDLEIVAAGLMNVEELEERMAPGLTRNHSETLLCDSDQDV